jgi:hypothetical protein
LGRFLNARFKERPYLALQAAIGNETLTKKGACKSATKSPEIARNLPGSAQTDEKRLQTDPRYGSKNHENSAQKCPQRPPSERREKRQKNKKNVKNAS